MPLFLSLTASQNSEDQGVEDELEPPNIPNALSRWEEVSAVLDGPGAVWCMHNLRDKIKAKWAEIYSQENPKDSEEESSSIRRRATQNDSPLLSSSATSTANSIITSALSAGANAPTSVSSCMRLDPTVRVPAVPYPSDEATPSSHSPQNTSTTVDQLRSSLRQVADALAETVAAVRSTREQLLGREEEPPSRESSNQEPSMEPLESREELEMCYDDPIPLQQVPVLVNPNAVVSPSNTTTTSSSSALPVMATFDGSQESAVATLASTNPDDPLYTFLSAVARAPAPPTSDTPSTTVPSQTRPTTQPLSGSVSPRLPVFAQFQEQPPDNSSTTETTLSAETSTASPVIQSAIRTPVIQQPRSTLSSVGSANVALPLVDIQQLAGTGSSSRRELPDLASHTINQGQIQASSESSLPIQIPVSSDSNLSIESQEIQTIPTTSSSTLAQSITDFTSQTQLSPSSTPPSNSQRPSLQSPSPSDTLAPLLISSLQLPSSASTSVSLSSVIHDHPHFGITQPSAMPSTSGGSPNLSAMIPVAGPSTLISSVTSNTSQQGEPNSDNQEVPESISIDPTFLAALPHSIRQEVLAQHRREQRAQQSTREAGESAALFQSRISPEFLAALPLNIQTEVSFTQHSVVLNCVMPSCMTVSKSAVAVFNIGLVREKNGCPYLRQKFV